MVGLLLSFLLSFFWAIVGAIVGAILSPIATLINDWYRYRRSRIDLCGDWLSSWERKPGNNEWIEVEVKVSFSWSWLPWEKSRFRFYTVEDGVFTLENGEKIKYNYKGEFNIVGDFLLGSWESTNESSRKGIFSLAVPNNKTHLYGFITAYDHKDDLKYKKYAFAKVRGYLNEARELIDHSLTAR
jgi:hypothetical protein